MDVKKFTKIANDPKRSESELRQLYKNALACGNEEYARMAKETLESRFPVAGSARSRRGGKRPTKVRFLQCAMQFPSEKKAYVWLVEKFMEREPGIFSRPSWDTEYVSNGRVRSYFAPSLEELFSLHPDHASDSNKYVRLSNGWYATLVLSGESKFQILNRLGGEMKLRFKKDWDFAVVDSTEELLNRQKATVSATNLLDTLSLALRNRKLPKEEA